MEGIAPLLAGCGNSGGFEGVLKLRQGLGVLCIAIVAGILIEARLGAIGALAIGERPDVSRRGYSVLIAVSARGAAENALSVSNTSRGGYIAGDTVAGSGHDSAYEKDGIQV